MCPHLKIVFLLMANICLLSVLCAHWNVTGGALYGMGRRLRMRRFLDTCVWLYAENSSVCV